jgi:hypothetical protein
MHQLPERCLLVGISTEENAYQSTRPLAFARGRCVGYSASKHTQPEVLPRATRVADWAKEYTIHPPASAGVSVTVFHFCPDGADFFEKVDCFGFGHRPDSLSELCGVGPVRRVSGLAIILSTLIG